MNLRIYSLLVLVVFCACTVRHRGESSDNDGFEMVSYTQPLNGDNTEFKIINRNLAIDAVCIVASPLTHCWNLKSAVGKTIPKTQMDYTTSDTLIYNRNGLTAPCEDVCEFLTIVKATKR